MRAIYRLALLSSIVLIVVLAVWYRSEHLNRIAYPDLQTSDQQQAFNEQQAEDLVMTIELFLSQVKLDLLHWEESLTNNQNEAAWIEEELNNHAHIDGFASYELPSETLIYEHGSLPEDSIDKFQRQSTSGDQWLYSEPYTSRGTKKMVVGLENDDEFFISEVDLSFVEHYVKELASLSDNNGNFFIGNSGLDLSFSESEATVDELSARRKIPELKWDLYLSSELENTTKEEMKKGEVVVVLAEEVEPEKWAEDHDVFLLDQMGKTVVVRDLTKEADEMMNQWDHDPSVKYMEPNYNFKKQTSNKASTSSKPIDLPNDELYDFYQWNLKQMNLEGVWNETQGSEGVPVAIVDSGIDPEHRDLQERVVKGYNAFENNESYFDDNGHGTHVAGIFGAVTNNEDGIAGVTWNAPILAVKVLDDEAIGNSFSIAEGIYWATDNGAKVINLSLGDEHDSEVMYEAIRYAYDNDVVLIAATGNDNVETPMYPAAYDEVLAVGSTNQNRERSFFSNFGDHTDVTAPGEHIPSTFPGGQYVMMSGTSMSAPHVAGIASLIRSQDEDLTNEDVYEKIRVTADDIGPAGFDRYHGYGMINASEAMNW
ncbi:S8 family peptidase [Salipaludibacillus sp. HK11]|uniref:S8 family peptidase n=1 Tax=Salipaludibacillus sp. HK11 TaxID=3394320 RepID=UPI0039FDC83D